MSEQRVAPGIISYPLDIPVRYVAGVHEKPTWQVFAQIGVQNSILLCMRDRGFDGPDAFTRDVRR